MSKNTEITPKNFNLNEWVAGLAPATRDYEVAGVTFTLRALTKTARDNYLADTEDLDPVERDLGYLALHIVSPEDITIEALTTLHEVRGPEVNDMLSLALELDTKPENRISPRFLPTASD